MTSLAQASTLFLLSLVSSVVAAQQREESTRGASAAAPDVGGKADAGGAMISLRLGTGMPFGKAGRDAPGSISHGVLAQVPVGLDLGYFVTPNIMIGAYGQFAPLITQRCSMGASCSGLDMRVGIQAQYHISPTEKLNPWFGLGAGYEVLNLTESGGPFPLDTAAKGLEIANLQGGLDWMIAHGFRMGPFVNFSIGEFLSVSAGGQSVDINNKSLHEWLTIGVRGSFYGK
jgi:outer membrane protein W